MGWFSVFRQKASSFLDSNVFLVFMVSITSYSLVGEGFSILFLPQEADGVITTFDQIVVAIFLLEIVMSSIVKDGYLYDFASSSSNSYSTTKSSKGGSHSYGLRSGCSIPLGSFYFWLDVASVVSLLVHGAFTGGKGVPVSYLTTNQVSQRFTRATKVTGQLSKVLRIMRSFSFFRIVKFSQKKESQQAVELDQRLLYSEGFEDERESPQTKMKMGSTMSALVNKRIILGGVLAIAIIPLCSYTNDTPTWKFVVYALEALSTSPVFLSNFTSGLVNDFDDILYVVVGNTTLLDRRVSSLRGEEQMNYMGNVASIIINKKREARAEASDSTLLVILIVILFGTLIYLLNQDLSTMIVEPVASMIYLIETISLDPLADISSKNVSTGRQGLETTLLLQTIGKIASLVKIGFGAAGADIIRRNLHESSNFKLNLFSSGHIVNCIFTFCDIRNFTDTTECLQEEVMVFVNRIACILHSLVTQCQGSANKNVGDAFLLLWKIDDGDGGMMEDCAELADKALYCILKFTCELIKQNTEVCSFSTAAAQRLYQRMPDYRPKVGFGLHKGWAVEGAIGSDQKIDVSYISPDVTYVEFLQDLSKDYGCTVVLSDSFFRMLSSYAQYNCRQLDCITRTAEEEAPRDIFTYDCNLDEVIALMAILNPQQEPPSSSSGSPEANNAAGTPRRPEIRNSRTKVVIPTRSPSFKGMPPLMTKGKSSRQVNSLEASTSPRSLGGGSPSDSRSSLTMAPQIYNNNTVLNTIIPPYDQEVWETDPELIALRRGITNNFRSTWNFAVSSYLAGEWKTALKGFQTTFDLSGGHDKPSKFLISVIEAAGGVAPPDWDGFRSL